MPNDLNQINNRKQAWIRRWTYNTPGSQRNNRDLSGLNLGQQGMIKDKEKKYLMQLPDEPNRFLSKQELQDFEKQGVLHVKNILSKTWIKKIQKTVLNLAENPSEMDALDNPSGVATSRFTWYLDDDMRDIIFRCPTAHLGQQLLHSNSEVINDTVRESEQDFLYNTQGPVRFFYDQLFVKYGQGGKTPWHQDNSFWPTEGGDVITIWLPLTNVNIYNGGLEYVLGSHKWNKKNQQYIARPVSKNLQQLPADRQHLQAFPEESIISYTNGSRCKDNVDNRLSTQGKHVAVSYDTSPGDALIFTSNTWHGAPQNQSTKLRAGLALRYFKPGLRYNPKRYGDKTQFMPLWWNHGVKEQQSLQGPFFPQLLPVKHAHEVQLRLDNIVVPDPIKVKEWQAQNKKITAKL